MYTIEAVPRSGRPRVESRSSCDNRQEKGDRHCHHPAMNLHSCTIRNMLDLFPGYTPAIFPLPALPLQMSRKAGQIVQRILHFRF